jgi:hypothetical protein
MVTRGVPCVAEQLSELWDTYPHSIALDHPKYQLRSCTPNHSFGKSRCDAIVKAARRFLDVSQSPILRTRLSRSQEAANCMTIDLRASIATTWMN